MISCDECQKKIVALFDREASEGDEPLISTHLRDCPRCRAFQDEMVRIRQEFVSLPAISLPAEVREKLVREAEADLLQRKAVRGEKRSTREPWPRKFRRLAWASGLAILAVIVASSLVCQILSKKVAALRDELEIAERAVALAQTEGQLTEARETGKKEREAISSLHFRIQQLEERFQRFSSPRIVSYPEDAYDLSYRRSSL